jgi:hypothetical protein
MALPVMTPFLAVILSVPIAPLAQIGNTLEIARRLVIRWIAARNSERRIDAGSVPETG